MSLQESFGPHGLDALRNWLVSQQLPLCFERSVRLSAASFQTERALFSIPTEAIAGDAVAAVLQICAAMSSPLEFRSSIAERFADAQFVHFGFERSAESLIGKCYLEFCCDAAVEKQIKSPVFLGYKWSATHSESSVISEYIPQQVTSWQTLVDRVLADLPLTIRHSVDNLLKALSSGSATNGDDASLVRLLKVTEANNPRLSYDVNVYNLERHISDIAPQIRSVSTQFECPQERVEEWLRNTESATVGHIAVGRGRNGSSFCTIYHAASINDID